LAGADYANELNFLVCLDEELGMLQIGPPMVHSKENGKAFLLICTESQILRFKSLTNIKPEGSLHGVKLPQNLYH
jgi:hypothetical protein